MIDNSNNSQPTNNKPTRGQLQTQYAATDSINKADKMQHVETETMKLKKFDDTNIENHVNNTRNLKYILQNNDLCQKHHRNKKHRQFITIPNVLIQSH